MTVVPDSESTKLRRRFGVAATVFTALFVILMGRYFWIQIVRGDEYRERARVSFTTKERLPARRGEIKDRHGEVLAHNVAHHSLTVLPHALRDPQVRGAVLRRLAIILELTREEREALDAEVVARIDDKRAWQPVTVDEELVSTHCPHDGTLLDLDTGPGAQLLYCSECGLTHEAIDESAARCPYDKRKLTWDSAAHQSASCGKCKRSFVTAPICPNDASLLTAVEHNLSCQSCGRRFTNEVAVLAAHRHELPRIQIAARFGREYPRAFHAAHLVGYINSVTREDRENHPGVYALDDKIGRNGAERAFEAELRGVPGEAEYFKGADKSLRRGFRAAKRGYDVWLTIDSRLQQEMRQALRYHRSGAAVMLDPRSGEVLAMYSTPGYDPGAWSRGLSRQEWESIKGNPYNPMINKALTPYAPGSVYKIVTSLAGLDLGLTTPEETIHCPGHYDYGGRRFHCHYRAGHGAQDMVQALKNSCDVYFYRLGERIGMDRLAHYGEMFGYGLPTGIELSERTGLVPTEGWYESTALGFQPGHTLSVSIGQGSLIATPLQVARSFAALANGGRMLRARIVRQYVDEQGEVVQRFLPVDDGRLVGTPEELAVIREGLVRVVNDGNGTGKEAALDEMVVAGKTGTAEAAEGRRGADEELKRWLKEDHAWFAAYAPADDPQVVVVVFLEHGGSGGKRAAPVAKQLLQSWLRAGYLRPPTVEPDRGASAEGVRGQPRGRP
ncbi:MAG: penicillin-binding protein 2 [Proteobacteria bacterium]|nr:MAG: penicillin-binding protein 2 [Pseudomonadota bacterium]